MKVSHVALTLAAATAASAQIDDVPMCALDCLMDGLSESKCDETMDFKCQCGEADGLVGQVVPCVRDACDFDEQQSARKIAIDTCNSFGVSISLPPPESTGATGSAGPTATESSTATATSGSPAVPTETDGGDGDDGDDSDGGDGGDGGDETEGGDPTETEGAAPTDADGAASGLKASVGGGVLAALLAVAAYL